MPHCCTQAATCTQVERVDAARGSDVVGCGGVGCIDNKWGTVSDTLSGTLHRLKRARSLASEPYHHETAARVPVMNRCGNPCNNEPHANWLLNVHTSYTYHLGWWLMQLISVNRLVGGVTDLRRKAGG